VALRARREFPQISDTHADTLANDLETALTGFFQAGGLTLASLLFRNEPLKWSRHSYCALSRGVSENTTII